VEDLLRQHGDSVFRFIYRRSGERHEDAQDLTQETFLAAVALAGTYDGSCSVLTWLCSLAKLKVADHLRRQGRNKRAPESRKVEWSAVESAESSLLRVDSQTTESATDRLDAAAFLDGLTADLRDDERESLLLHYVEGFSIVEMAYLFKRSAKGVESLLTRAKRKCRETAARSLTAQGVREP
jgi:RNA polymerase sigma-70 factor (ECF subfamily)